MTSAGNPALQGLPAIPWSQETGDFGSVWRWETPHFIVTVNGNERSCYFQISDKSTGTAKPFHDGQAATFGQAELQIRTTIGKSYRPELGYQTYAGPLATIFTVGTGKAVNLGAYRGREITVTVTDENGQPQQYRGTATIEHYDLLLRDGDTQYRISPSHITAISSH